MNIFEKHPTQDAYRYGASFTPYAVVAVDKRFSDAELAAEYLAAELTCRVRSSRCERYPEPAMWDHYERGVEQASTIRRFATLPNYDEEPAAS